MRWKSISRFQRRCRTPPDPDCPFLAEGTVFGVKNSLIVDFVKVDDANQAAAAGLPSPFWSVKWDFVLARKDQVGPRS